MIPKLIIGALCWSSIFSILWFVKEGGGQQGSHLGEHVPDARTLAVLVPSALDLVKLQIGKFFLNEKIPDRQPWPIPRGSHQERNHRAALPRDCMQGQGQCCTGEWRRGRWPGPSFQAGLPHLPGDFM